MNDLKRYVIDSSIFQKFNDIQIGTDELMVGIQAYLFTLVWTESRQKKIVNWNFSKVVGNYYSIIQMNLTDNHYNINYMTGLKLIGSEIKTFVDSKFMDLCRVRKNIVEKYY